MWRGLVSGIAEIASSCRRTPNMPVLLTSAMFGQFAAGILAPVLPLFLYSRGMSFQDLGIIFSIGALAPIVLQPLIGVAADKFGRKIMIVGSSLVLSLMLPVYVFINNIRAFAVLHAARSAVYASGHPAHEAMMGDIMPKTKRATLFGVYGSLKTMAYVVALFCSGYLLRLGVDFNAAFYFSGGLFIVSSLILLAGLKETRHLALKEAGAASTATSNERAGRRGLGQGLRDLRSHFRVLVQYRELGLLLAIRFFFTFGLGVYPIYMPLLAVEMGAPVEAIGPIIATAWLTYAIIQPVGGRLSDLSRLGRVDLLLIGLLLLVLAGAGIGLASTLVILVVMWAATGIGDGLFRPGFHALLIDLVPPQARGQYFGASGAVMTLGSVLAPVVYGSLAHNYSISTAIMLSPVMWAAGVLCLGILLVWVRANKAANASS